MITKVVEFFALEAINSISVDFSGGNINGEPVCGVNIEKNTFDIPVKDIDCVIEMLQGIKQEVAPFLCREQFEAKKPDLLKKYGIAWVRCFEQYHLNHNDE